MNAYKFLLLFIMVIAWRGHSTAEEALEKKVTAPVKQSAPMVLVQNIFDLLPNELIIGHIFPWLTRKELKNAALVCRRLYQCKLSIRNQVLTLYPQFQFPDLAIPLSNIGTIRVASNCKLQQIRFFLRKLPQFSNLHTLDLSWTQPGGEDGMRALGRALGQMPKIKSLYLVGMGLMDEISGCVSALRGLQDLRTLDVSHNYLGNKHLGEMLFAPPYPALPKLEFLNVSYNFIEMAELVPALQALPMLRTLGVGHREIKSEEITEETLSNSRKQLPHITIKIEAYHSSSESESEVF